MVYKVIMVLYPRINVFKNEYLVLLNFNDFVKAPLKYLCLRQTEIKFTFE